jgi:hypothetical protein
MEMILFEITNSSLHYARFCGFLTLEFILAIVIFKNNLGEVFYRLKYFSISKDF